MEEPPVKRRQTNFSQEELLALVYGMKKRWHMINRPLSPTLTSATQQEVWEAIAVEVNAVSDRRWSSHLVHSKFLDFSGATKEKTESLSKELCFTGGGPRNLPQLSEAEIILGQLLDPIIMNSITLGLEAEVDPSAPPAETKVNKETVEKESNLVKKNGHNKAAESTSATPQPDPPQATPPLPPSPQPTTPQPDPAQATHPQPALPQPTLPHSATLDLHSPQQAPPQAATLLPAPHCHLSPPSGSSRKRKIRKREPVTSPPGVTEMLEIQQGILEELRHFRHNSKVALERMANSLSKVAEIAAKIKQ